MEVYIDLAKAIEVDLYGRTEAASEYRDVEVSTVEDNISGKERDAIRRKMDKFRKEAFKAGTPEQWYEYSERMEAAWEEWKLPPAAISPEYYVASMMWQVAPTRLTAKRLQEALEEDMGRKVPFETAQGMLVKYSPNLADSGPGLEQHQYAIEVDGTPKEIIQRVAASDARAEFKDTVSGAYIRLNPDNMDEMLIFYGDEIAEAESDEQAVEILTHLRKHKKWPESAYVFDPLAAKAGLVKGQVVKIKANLISGESYRYDSPTGWTTCLPEDSYCVHRFVKGGQVVLAVCDPDHAPPFKSSKHLYSVSRDQLQKGIDNGDITFAGTMEDIEAEVGAEEKPSFIDVWKSTITKHYRPSESMHKGSIRTIKTKGTLVILGCPKDAKWDGKCTENQALVETHVNKTKKAMEEVRDWEKKGVMVNYKSKQEGIQPRDPETAGPGPELIQEVTEAVEKAEAIS